MIGNRLRIALMTMKLYGFWRSLATYRVRVALALKGLEAEQQYINLLQGVQHGDDYKAVNPQSVVPALVIDDGPPLFQSLAIIEYLEEICPEPALLPKDPRGRARVRGLSLIVACDAHPLIVPRIRNYLEREMHQDEAARNRWLQHWTLKALEALEAHLAKERETGRFCHGDTPTMADLCLASQVFAAGYFDTPTTGVPTVKRIFDECMKIDAFDRSQPTKQPDAPKSPTH
jgi:maleylacetoacetate isomerase/maleylpyruvate isomerase